LRYCEGMDRTAIQAFVSRDRASVERLKRLHWVRQFRRHGASATVAAGRALWAHARRVRPDWPGPRERDEDLTHHIELKRQLDRAADAFAGR
jgi:hypothetical protein